MYLLFCSLKLYLLIDVLKTTHGDPGSSLLLLACWGLVTDLEEHLTLLMEIAISPVLVHQWRESCCNWAWQDQLLLRVVIQSHNNRQEGVNLFCVKSAFAVYMYIYEIYVHLQVAVLTAKSLVSGWTERSLKKFNHSAICRLLKVRKRWGG